MDVSPPYVLWYGRDEAPSERIALRAGPLQAELDGVDLRYVRLGPIEIVRRLHVAVRDPAWTTVAGSVSELEVKQSAHDFRVDFRMGHRGNGLDFSWRGAIRGDRAGRIVYAMDGKARRRFQYNRIGLCVLLPPHEYAGRPFRGVGPLGGVESALPVTIGPQRLESGRYHALFDPVRDITFELTEGTTVQLSFEGDLFEMEDQRNWTDGSFKLYSTPLALGVPHTAAAGQRFVQDVELAVTARASTVPSSAAGGPVRLTLGRPTGPLPRVGFCASGADDAGSPSTVAALRRLRPAHIRVDLHLRTDDGWRNALQRAADTAVAVGCGLELAVFAGPGSDAALAQLADDLSDHRAGVVRVLAFCEGARSGSPEETTPESVATAVLGIVRRGAPHATFGGGTDMYFCELNRRRTAIDALDVVAYSVVPQVHAFDETSMMETLETQAETVASARAFTADRPLAVGPVTLTPRSGWGAPAGDGAGAGDPLQQPPDPRQPSLFAAAWTLGSIKYLAEAGADSVTYFATTGPHGLLLPNDAPAGSLPFPPGPGSVFPVYHVFADLTEWHQALVVKCASSDPLRIVALAVRHREGPGMLIANLTHRPQEAQVECLPDGPVILRRLDEDSALEAMGRPDAFRDAIGEPAAVREGRLSVTLSPFACVRVDSAI